MRWIEWRCPFHCILSGSSSTIKNVPNFAILKSPPADILIWDQILLQESIYGYSICWLQCWCPFTRMWSSSSSVFKNVPNFSIFESPSTDTLIYSQSPPQEGRHTYLVRWVEWYYPFLMNYILLYSCCIGVSYNVIVHMNKSMDHGMLPSYISFGVWKFHDQ